MAKELTVAEKLKNLFDLQVLDSKIDEIAILRGELPMEVSDFEVMQNYPNPFNPSTTINYSLAENSLVNLEVFDIMGRRVTVLIDNRLHSAGTHTQVFDATGLSSGMYIYRLTTNQGSISKRMLLLK